MFVPFAAATAPSTASWCVRFVVAFLPLSTNNLVVNVVTVLSLFLFLLVVPVLVLVLVVVVEFLFA